MESDDKKLEDVLAYRSCTTRACYLAQDRPDIIFASKEYARGVSEPTEKRWRALRRLDRYLKGRLRQVWQFRDQEH
eukprot:12640726-Heterocapsa_arctica.AAC.1